LIDRLAPGNVLGAGDMAGTHGKLFDAFRREDLAGVFVGRTNVDEMCVGLAFGDGDDISEVGTQVGIALADLDGRSLLARLGGVERQAPGLPQLAAAIEQLDLIAKTIDVEYPGAPGGEPVIVVAIEDDGGLR